MSLDDLRRDIDAIRKQHNRPANPRHCGVVGCGGQITHMLTKGPEQLLVCRPHAEAAAWTDGVAITEVAR